MNPFYLLLVLITAMALPAVMYGKQKVKRSSVAATKTYTDTVYINYAAFNNFSKKELMKMEAVKFYARPISIKAGTTAATLSAKERIKSNIVKNAVQPTRIIIPAVLPLQNLSLKEKMRLLP